MRSNLIRVTCLLLGGTLLGTACSRMPPGAEGGAFGAAESGFGSTENGVGPGGASFGGVGEGAVGGGGAAGDALGAVGGGPASGGSASRTSGQTGPDGTPLGSQAGGAAAAALSGVDGKKVHVVFTAKKQACGDSPSTSGAEVLDEQAVETLAQFIAFFNKDVLALHGWSLTHEIVDDGGRSCPEKGRAAAQQIIKEIKPFAVLGISVNDGTNPVVADLITKAGIRHIGINFNTYDEFKARAGLAFSEFIIPQRSYEYLEDYIAVRVKGTKVANPGTGLGEEDRRYGIVVVDAPEYRKLAAIMKQRLRARGVDLEQTYFLSGDAGVAGQTSLNVANKMRADGINTLIFDFFPNGFLSGVALTNSMASQNYRPDILIATYWFPLLDQLHDPTVWSNAHGVAIKETLVLRTAVTEDGDSGPGYHPRYTDVSENMQPMMDTWYNRLGNKSDPAGTGLNPFNYFNQLGLLSLGLINSGDQITAESFADGIYSTALGRENRCGSWRFFGRESPYQFLHNLTAEDNAGSVRNFTTVYWVQRPNSEEGVTPLTNGYYESFDNYEFVTGAGDLSPTPSHDTGVQGVVPFKQEKIGVRAWTPCSQFNMTD